MSEQNNAAEREIANLRRLAATNRAAAEELWETNSDEANACESSASDLERLADTLELVGRKDAEIRQLREENERLRGGGQLLVQDRDELRAKLAAYESQEPARIVMPPPPYNPDLEPERMTDYERGEAQGRCDMWAEIKRLNAVQQEGGERWLEDQLGRRS